MNVLIHFTGFLLRVYNFAGFPLITGDTTVRKNQMLSMNSWNLQSPGTVMGTNNHISGDYLLMEDVDGTLSFLDMVSNH